MAPTDSSRMAAWRERRERAYCQLAPTERQLQLLNLILGGVRETGVQPSLHELAEAMGIRHLNGVRQIIRALAKKGYLGRQARGEARSLRILRTPDGRPFRGFDLRADPEPEGEGN